MQLHASCIAFDGKGVLIKGRSGSGKSSLALNLISLGAALVSDDRTNIRVENDWPYAYAPERLLGLIEARGVGILKLDALRKARIELVIDLDQTETERMPLSRETVINGHAIPLLHKSESPHFFAAIRLYVLAGKALV